MATILSMPKWGLAMKNGRVVEWLKQPGDAVQQGEPVVEIESEKAVNEVESPVTGVVRRLVVPEGESAPISAPIAVIAAPGEELSDEQVETLIREDVEAKQQQAAAASVRRTEQAARPATAPQKEREGSAPRPGGQGERIVASPAARRLAQELGVDLATVSGSGPKGMIGREDVLRAAEAAQASAGGTESSEAEEADLIVDGVRIHYLLAGPVDAPAVVFVHGLGGSLTTWSLNLQAFAGRFRVCALDLPGAGESDKPERDYSVAALADSLARFLDVLGPRWRQVSLIGHSLGGAIALALAREQPERVNRLVLVDSAGLGREIDATLVRLVRSKPDREHIREELACSFADANLVQQTLIDQIYQSRIQPGAHMALLATADAAFAEGQQKVQLRDALESFAGPVLLVWGAMDRILPVTHAQALSGLPQRRLEVFHNSAHCPHIERSEDFNKLVMSFLQE